MPTIKKASLNDVPNILSILKNTEIFENISQEKVIQDISQNFTLIYIIDNEVVGYLSYRPLSEDGEDCAIIHNLDTDAYVIDTLAILPEYQDLGFATGLLTNAMFNIHPSSIYLLGFTSNDTLRGEGLYKYLGFTLIKEVPNYNGHQNTRIYLK